MAGAVQQRPVKPGPPNSPGDVWAGRRGTVAATRHTPSEADDEGRGRPHEDIEPRRHSPDKHQKQNSPQEQPNSQRRSCLEARQPAARGSRDRNLDQCASARLLFDTGLLPWLGDTRFICEHDRLNTIPQPEFGEDARDVRFDGWSGDEQISCDLGIGLAPCHSLQDLHLAVGQRCQGRKLCTFRPFDVGIDDSPHYRWRNDGIPFSRPEYSSYKTVRFDVLEQKSGRARLQSGVNVLIRIKCRQGNDPWLVARQGKNPTRRFYPSQARHAQVHEHDVWFDAAH